MRLRIWAGVVVCMTGLILAATWLGAQAPQGNSFAQQGRLRDRTLLYVVVPTKPGNSDTLNGAGILTFDVNDNFRFVKRIPTFDYPAWEDYRVTDEVKGLAISTSGKLVMSTLKALTAFDLTTEKKVWSKTYEGGSIDRFAMSPDGKVLYAPQLGAPRAAGTDGWLVIDVDTGSLIKKVETPKTKGGHNTIWSADGSKVFMAGVFSHWVTVADPKTNQVIQVVGPFGGKDVPMGKTIQDGNIRPYTINGRGTLVFANVQGLWGFEIGDVATGKVIQHVDLGAYKPQMLNCEGLPNHGIAMSPDESELWLTDNITGSLRVFDATTTPPIQKAIVMMPRHDNTDFAWPCWVTMGLDGKYVYPSTGDVIDAKTRRVVASLKDEHGNWVRSEKIVEAHWSNGKIVRVSDQFGRGMVGAQEPARTQGGGGR